MYVFLVDYKRTPGHYAFRLLSKEAGSPLTMLGRWRTLPRSTVKEGSSLRHTACMCNQSQ